MSDPRMLLTIRDVGPNGEALGALGAENVGDARGSTGARSFPVDRVFLQGVWTAARLMHERCTVIGTHGPEGELARRLIVRKEAGGSIYVHEWLRSDPDELQDRPWDWCSVILQVGYWEITEAGREWREPGSIRFRKAEERHRVEIDPAKPRPVSLFITGPERREWGFHTAAGFVIGREYRGRAKPADTSGEGGA